MEKLGGTIEFSTSLVPEQLAPHFLTLTFGIAMYRWIIKKRTSKGRNPSKIFNFAMLEINLASRFICRTFFLNERNNEFVCDWIENTHENYWKFYDKKEAKKAAQKQGAVGYLIGKFGLVSKLCGAAWRKFWNFNPILCLGHL